VYSNGNLFATDTGNYVIRKINYTGRVSIFAGTLSVCGWSDGKGTKATFTSIRDIAMYFFGNLVLEMFSYTIRKINASGYVPSKAVSCVGGLNEGPALTIL
jgi:hypothetical protein